ncbi:hypothetical protein R3P38DRAFT_2791340 [Favolaschia claudopus]|uniref:Uncharacterized protein n=1 Tax=Favolaschia claudopus TaxID=2862362 RepID=A0AAW0AI74_9AGAR
MVYNFPKPQNGLLTANGSKELSGGLSQSCGWEKFRLLLSTQRYANVGKQLFYFSKPKNQDSEIGEGGPAAPDLSEQLPSKSPGIISSTKKTRSEDKYMDAPLLAEEPSGISGKPPVQTSTRWNV